MRTQCILVLSRVCVWVGGRLHNLGMCLSLAGGFMMGVANRMSAAEIARLGARK